MASENFIVPPKSWDEIAALSQEVRTLLGAANKPFVPVVDILEKVLDQTMEIISFEVGSLEEMGTAEGLTDPNGNFIRIREDVYELAHQGDGRARFTLAHELGHLFLHTNVPLARCKPGEREKSFRMSEPQANQFAAEFLMPRSMISSFDRPGDIALRHGVSEASATNRIDFMRLKGLI